MILSISFWGLSCAPSSSVCILALALVKFGIQVEVLWLIVAEEPTTVVKVLVALKTFGCWTHGIEKFPICGVLMTKMIGFRRLFCPS